MRKVEQYYRARHFNFKVTSKELPKE